MMEDPLGDIKHSFGGKVVLENSFKDRGIFERFGIKKDKWPPFLDHIRTMNMGSNLL